MFCTKCGKQLDDGLKFCTACGAQVPVREGADAPKEADALEGVTQDDAAADLPDSALEPSEGPDDAPDFAFDATTVIPVAVQGAQRVYATPGINSAFVASDDAGATNPVMSSMAGTTDSDGATGASGATKMRGRSAAIAISSAVAVVILAAVGVMFALGVFDPATPINAEAFPNDVIRGAVLEQLDSDGDGRLSDAEADEVTALVYTPDGAKFVSGGEQVDVSRLREEIDAAPGASAPNASSASSGDGNGGELGIGAANLIESLEAFSNLKTLVASDSKLTYFDLRDLPQLEYVDLRGNPDISEIDLSNNPDIKTLFCDPDTKLVGLEEAGLYYADLITGMSFSDSNVREPIEVEYDSHARPIKANGYKLMYDDSGRLIKEEQLGDNNGWHSGFAYGDNGLLSNVSMFFPLDASAITLENACGYDDQGRLSQFASGKGENKNGKSVAVAYNDAGEFAYADGKLATYKATDKSILFDMDDSGLLKQAVSDTGDAQSTLQCGYNASGSMDVFREADASLDGDTGNAEYKTDYSASGAPVKTTTGDGYAITYECNADGYITQIKWGEGDYYMAGQTGKIAYVKRVGRLVDRASERFVPVIRPVISKDWVFDGYPMTALEDWLATTGSVPPVTVMVIGPQKVVERQAGLFPNMLQNPNEIALAAYDREHWADGLTFSGAQPIAADDAAKLLEKASKVMLPVPAQTYLDDKVYGPVIKQYASVLKDAASMSVSSLIDKAKGYEFVDSEMASFMGETYSRGDVRPGVIDVSLMDLNSDGLNELVIALPDMFQYPDEDDSGEQQINALAVFGQKDGKPVEIASAAYRSWCWVTSNGDVVADERAGMIGAISVYRWDGSESTRVGGIDYSKSDGDNYDITTIEPNGSKKKSVVSSSVLEKKLDAFWKTRGHAKLNWTPISVS